MKTLKNIKKAPFEIGQILAANKEICALLLDDTNDPKAADATFNDLLTKNYITIYPPVADGAIKDYTRNTYLVILIDAINTNANENNLSVSGTIYITTDESHILLTNNRNRLLELADKILQVLDGVKISSAGEIHVTDIMHIMLTNFRAGYRISFTFSDQQARKAEI